jgi:hypothetical protein
MTRLHRIFGLGLALAGVSAALPAHAEATEGAVQIGLGTTIVNHTSSTLTIHGDLSDTDRDISQTNWGLGNAVSGELGYGLNESLVLGTFLQLAGSSQTTEYDGGDSLDVDNFTLFLGPKLDYMFSPGGRVRPFVGAVAGIMHVSSTQESSVPIVPKQELSITAFQLQGRVGLRAFITDSLSIDPSFVLTWTTGSGDNDTGNVSQDVDYSGVTFGLNLGLSGWVL